MIVRTVLTVSLLLASTASAQTYRPAASLLAPQQCVAGQPNCTSLSAAACNGHGRIAGRCVCFPGWTGANCEVPAPVPLPCNGHGDLVRNQCVCTTFWTGPECSAPGLSITGRAFRQ